MQDPNQLPEAGGALPPQTPPVRGLQLETNVFILGPVGILRNLSIIREESFGSSGSFRLRSLGNPSESSEYPKILRILWAFGILREFFGILQNPSESFGNPSGWNPSESSWNPSVGNPSGSFGNPSESFGNPSESFGILRDPSGILRNPSESFGNPWNPWNPSESFGLLSFQGPLKGHERAIKGHLKGH